MDDVTSLDVCAKLVKLEKPEDATGLVGGRVGAVAAAAVCTLSLYTESGTRLLLNGLIGGVQGVLKALRGSWVGQSEEIRERGHTCALTVPEAASCKAM
jgi:hypothetical protein